MPLLNGNLKSEIFNVLLELFNFDELKLLAFSLNIDKDDLPNQDKRTFARELIDYCYRREESSQSLACLLSVMWLYRPNTEIAELRMRLNPCPASPPIWISLGETTQGTTQDNLPPDIVTLLEGIYTLARKYPEHIHLVGDSQETNSGKQTGRILVVDNDKDWADRTADSLALLHRNVETAYSMSQALEVLKASPRSYSLLIIDLHLEVGQHDFSGLDVIHQARMLDVTAPCFLVSAGLTAEVIRRLFEDKWLHAQPVDKQVIRSPEFQTALLDTLIEGDLKRFL